MNGEIKIAYEEASKLVNKVEKNIANIEADLLRSFADKNELNTVRKINEFNNALAKVTEAYKQLLIKNNESVLQTIETFREMDNSLSNSFKGEKK
ncbi:DUF5344 family protein [Terribacillus sp. DMT04]|uniref:DUF5344 family protein n=1 Tax=Terribacillus sp. DMT04 TaxID=2850441 RepID=UPI001C2C7E1A|nr:DUF5344 family protein [Terribacillus sp. DMT04]QXE00987.1 YwqI/YxiC family protein [Terribacillus sp. DMT04]